MSFRGVLDGPNAVAMQALRRDLRETIIPGLASDNARLVATMMDEMLGWLVLDLPLAGQRADVSRDSVMSEASRLAQEDEAARELSKEVDRPIDRKVTAQVLDPWLARCFPDAGRVTGLNQIIGGYSKDTWMAKVSGSVGGYSELVIRRDLPFGPGENSVVDEYGLLCGLFANGICVPEPLAVEADSGVLGTPFLLFPRLDGQAVFVEWPDDAGNKQRIANQVAETMARFHGIDPRDLGLDKIPMRDAVSAMVEEWRGKWERRQPGPSAIMSAAFTWLAANVPDISEPAALVHGDVSFRNTLLNEGKLSALLDWEFAHSGDPAEDIGYFRFVAESQVDWDETMRCYQQAGGAPFDAARARYYEVWRSTRNAVTSATAWYGLVHRHFTPSKAAYQGLALFRYFLRDIASKLEPLL